jgi:lipopolysaccharide biosynthesis regulator YciM
MKDLNVNNQITNRWENKTGKLFYRCGECGHWSTKNYIECPACHTTMTNGDITLKKRRKFR